MLRNEKFGEVSSEVPKFPSLNYTWRKIIFGVAYYRTLHVEVLSGWRENVGTKAGWLWYHKHLKNSVLDTSKKVVYAQRRSQEYSRFQENEGG